MLFAVTALILAPPLMLRRGQVEITPPEPLPLGGYTERHGKLMEPGGDPLYARCIELEQGGVRIAIVSVEMLTIPESLQREVASRIPKDVRLFMQATHTHCAPDSQMLNERMTFAIPGIASFKKRWLTWYSDKIASCVLDTLRQKGAEVKQFSGSITTVDANRARRKGGKPDKRFVRINGDNAPLLLFYTAHPTIFEPETMITRGDWIGTIMRRDPEVMVLNGAIGDVSPTAEEPTDEPVEEGVRDNHEGKLKDFFRRVEISLAHNKPKNLSWWNASGRPLAWLDQPIALLPKKPHPTFAKTNGIPEPLAQSLVDQFAPPKAQISAIRIGSLAIVGVPGEPTSILGNQIRAAGEKMGFKTVLVCSHVNGWIGYILDPQDYGRGGYEATLSFYGAGEGPKVVDAAVTALRKLTSASAR
jgi:neutral ceramidase